MNKKTKMWVGIGAVAVLGYFAWKKFGGTKANASGMTRRQSTRPIFGTGGGSMYPRVKECEVYTGEVVAIASTDGSVVKAYECARPSGVYSSTPPPKK